MNSNLKFSEKIAYGISNLYSWFILIIGTWLIRTYAPPNKEALITVAIIGFILAFGRVVDAVTDPLIAYFSDRTESRFGRRRIYLIFGTPFMCLFFYLLFAPPIPHQHHINIIYLTVVLFFFWISFTIVYIPYAALLPEIATTNEERLSLAAYITFFMLISNILGGLLSAYLFDKYSPKIMGLVFAVTTLIVMYATPLFVRERIKVTKEYKELKIFGAIITTLKNKQFLIFAIALFLFWLGWYVIANGLPYIFEVSLKLPLRELGKYFAAMIISGVIYTPIIRILASKLGKKFMYSCAMIVAALVFIMVFFAGMIPLSPVIIYTVLVVMGFPFACTFAMQQAIIAEIIDYDEKLTGLRREGMYYGVSGIVIKGGTSVSFLFTGFLFSQFGYQVGQDLGIRLLGITASIFAIIGFIIFQFYKLEKVK